MRNARIVWSLAALIIVLLGIGIGGYAQLGSSSSHLSNAPAIRAVSPTIPVVSPQPTSPNQPLSHAASADPAAPAATTHADPPARPATQAPARPATHAPARPATHVASRPAAGSTRSLAAPHVRPQPSAAPSVRQAAPAPQPAAAVLYVVQPGDSLWSLAAAHLGNPYRWVELYNLNRDRVEPGGQHLVNPDLICVGWTLQVPQGAAGWSI
jgi:nucleoid-associated protein YgaU